MYALRVCLLVLLGVGMAEQTLGRESDQSYTVYGDVVEIFPSRNNVFAVDVPPPSEGLNTTITGWLFELVDVDSGETLEFTPDERGLYVHHSGIHRMRFNEEDLPGAIMRSKKLIMGVSDYYNHRVDVPNGYGVIRRTFDQPWAMCLHIVHPPEQKRVQQRVTMWYHTTLPSEKSLHLDLIGSAVVHHGFGLDVPFERFSFVGKLPNRPVATLGWAFHAHHGVVGARIQDSLSGATPLTWRYENRSSVSSVWRSPTMWLPRPYSWVEGQFLYLHTEVAPSMISKKELHEHTGFFRPPMMLAYLYNVYDDETYMPDVDYALNPEKPPCNPSILGLPGGVGDCYFLDREITSPFYVSVHVPPPAYLRACYAEDEPSCYRAMGLPRQSPNA